MDNPTGSQFGPFLIDARERTLRRDGAPVPLTPKAFDVLVALLEKPGQLISKEELLQNVWCPDSTCLLVTDTLGADKPDALFQIALETGERRQLTHPKGLVRDADPAMSPDGSLLVFRRDATPGSGEFYRLSLKDGNDSQGIPVRLTATLYAGKPVWIPDSREVLFPARGGLWRLDALTGGTPRRLPFVGLDGIAPVVSRVPTGGRRLVYVHSFADTNVWRVDTARPGSPAASPPAAAKRR
ncbi:translocation protein TolB [Luteitalea pratensis]|uniref:Translocation protein TolB n=1 Tax=Luteitalea pratensis TaxID=1855912 RepID=A0A143PI67_LUTPR|nr:winged helix-turn-helix domain-containing protein [Luteitalea pratensis]AMY07950.1 translocation protein TolB [Luteitalea pratensis]